MLGLQCCAQDFSSCCVWASHWGGFSYCRARAQECTASVVTVRRRSSFSPQPLGHGLSSCGTRAWLPHSMRSLPRPEIEPMSPDLGGTSLIAQLVKNLPECRRPQFNSWVGKSHWRRDRLPTPVFLGFPCGSTGKE